MSGRKPFSIPGPIREQVDRIVADYPNVIVADWHSAIGARPELLQTDRIHPDLGGAYLYAETVRQAIIGRGAASQHPLGEHPRGFHKGHVVQQRERLQRRVGAQQRAVGGEQVHRAAVLRARVVQRRAHGDDAVAERAGTSRSVDLK